MYQHIVTAKRLRKKENQIRKAEANALKAASTSTPNINP
jgi:hypothetical protein